MLDNNSLDKLRQFAEALPAGPGETLDDVRVARATELRNEIEKIDKEIRRLGDQARRAAARISDSRRSSTDIATECEGVWYWLSRETRPLRDKRTELERQIDESL